VGGSLLGCTGLLLCCRGVLLQLLQHPAILLTALAG
jgi:hypothetical protein